MAQSTITTRPYINGRFVDIAKPEKTFRVLNPAKPVDILAQMGWHKDNVSAIIEGLNSASKKFQELKLPERLAAVMRLVSCLRDNSEEIKSQMMLELGRTRLAVDEEWRLCESVFNHLHEFCMRNLGEKTKNDGWSWQYAPLGKIMISGNVALPVYSLLATSLPTLVAGNAVTLRPSMHCPLSMSVIASCIHQANFPAGLVQIVYSDYEGFRRLILTHAYDTVLYTGAEESLEQLRRDVSHHSNTRVVLCSGGKNAAIVLPSAEIKSCVSKILYGAFVDCGQRLEATNLVFVHKDIVAEFTDKFVEAVKAMPIGINEEQRQSYFMGPMCSIKAQERFLRFQGIAARECEDTLRWGKTIDNPSGGYFVSPGVHLIKSEAVAKSVYASNAFFGPDVALVPVDSAEEANELLNSLNAARCVSVHTNFQEEVRMTRDKSNVPMVNWNSSTTDFDAVLPSVGRGRSGNSIVAGIHYMFSTVYPKTINLREGMSLFAALISFVLLAATLISSKASADYRKAVEGNDVVKSKIYPRTEKFELLPIGAGMILNQSFQQTFLLTGGATYHFNEWHALNVEGFFGLSSDSSERECVESFFLNETRAKRAAAAEGKSLTSNCTESRDYDPNVPLTVTEPPALGNETYEPPPVHAYTRKPAYMAIRRIDQMFGVNYQWTPVYGKQLFFLSAVGYLDVYTSVGLGMAMNTYWPSKTTNSAGQDIKKHGTNNLSEIGISGRPLPEKQTSPYFSAGVGNRFYFLDRFLINAEFRNFTIFGGDGAGGSDIMNFFALWGGVGIMF